MVKERMDLLELLRKGGMDGDVDFLREALRVLVEGIMDAEVSARTGAEYGERSPERVTQRNGYRSRAWDTRVGTMELHIPKLREGSYFPSLLEPRRRSERALLAVIQQAYVEGVSTRRVDDLVKALGCEGISKSQASRICQELDVVAFYSREYPLESVSIEKSADREWMWTRFSEKVKEYRKGHDERVKPLVKAAAVSGDIEPTGVPVNGKDITEDIRSKARELGFGEVGFTRYDRRYTFVSKKRWVMYEHAICLAMEQDYAQTQTIPSLEAEYAHFGTYEVEGAEAMKLADCIRSLGYHAQIHSPNDNSAPYIPMFVASGLGQLGANGQLLSPHFGSRSRLMLITTDAPVTYDQPIDYGIHKFCQKCQVCVNRCPGRALTKEKVWYRGVEKNKLIYDRCRPVQVNYEGCAVCMKVCPIQRYGMKPVMEHYVATGEVLGKGTENLEGYTLGEKGHFGPGELPHFDREFFDIPHGSQDEWLFEQFKQRLQEDSAPSGEELAEFATRVKAILDKSKGDVGEIDE